MHSITKYYQQSLDAEALANASTTDPGSTVEQSASIRRAVEDRMNGSRAEFSTRQEEDARRLDDLAVQLETLGLSKLSEKVSLWVFGTTEHLGDVATHKRNVT